MRELILQRREAYLGFLFWKADRNHLKWTQLLLHKIYVRLPVCSCKLAFNIQTLLKLCFRPHPILNLILKTITFWINPEPLPFLSVCPSLTLAYLGPKTNAMKNDSHRINFSTTSHKPSYLQKSWREWWRMALNGESWSTIVFLLVLILNYFK